MTLRAGEKIREGNFIKFSERDATPGNNEDKVPRIEDDGFLSDAQIDAAMFTSGEAFAVNTPLYLKASDSRVYKAKSDALGETLARFVGFAKTAATGAAEQVVVQTGGVVSGFSGLSTGSLYIISGATGGTITLGHSKYMKYVGVAISATKLKMINDHVILNRLSAASANTRGSASTSSVGGNYSFVKCADFTLAEIFIKGARFYWQSATGSSGSGAAYEIRRNTSTVLGTASHGETDSTVNMSVDVADCGAVPGDTLELWGKTTGDPAGTTYTAGLQIRYDMSDTIIIPEAALHHADQVID